VLRYFYADEIPPDLQKALEACFEFIVAGNYQSHGKNKPSSDDAMPLYDFQADHQLIYASMCQAYGEAWRDWHWWAWKAAFDHLPESTPIKQVIAIRARKPDKYMSGKERANLSELKELYRLNKATEELEMTPAEIESMIMNET